MKGFKSLGNKPTLGLIISGFLLSYTSVLGKAAIAIQPSIQEPKARSIIADEPVATPKPVPALYVDWLRSIELYHRQHLLLLISKGKANVLRQIVKKTVEEVTQNGEKPLEIPIEEWTEVLIKQYFIYTDEPETHQYRAEHTKYPVQPSPTTPDPNLDLAINKALRLR